MKTILSWIMWIVGGLLIGASFAFFMYTMLGRFVA